MLYTTLLQVAYTCMQQQVVAHSFPLAIKSIPSFHTCKLPQGEYLNSFVFQYAARSWESGICISLCIVCWRLQYSLQRILSVPRIWELGKDHNLLLRDLFRREHLGILHISPAGFSNAMSEYATGSVIDPLLLVCTDAENAVKALFKREKKVQCEKLGSRC